MNRPAISRPKSLREVATESATYADFGHNLKDFLHEVSAAGARPAALAVMLAEAPPLLAARFREGKICDAFLAATADHLSRIHRIHTPEWAQNPALVLDEPWFADPLPELRGLLLRDTPPAFKDKNLFVLASALSVA